MLYEGLGKFTIREITTLKALGRVNPTTNAHTATKTKLGETRRRTSGCKDSRRRIEPPVVLDPYTAVMENKGRKHVSIPDKGCVGNENYDCRSRKKSQNFRCDE
jgi:hypothetical protein